MFGGLRRVEGAFDVSDGAANAESIARLLTEPADDRDVTFGVETLIPGSPGGARQPVATFPGAERIGGDAGLLDDGARVIFGH